HSEPGSSGQNPRRFPLRDDDDDDLDRGTGPRRFLLRDLTLAAKNFSDANKLGEGGFGSIYRGYLSHEDIMVAIKINSVGSRQNEVKFIGFSREGKTEYRNEVKVISSLRHRNLVKLIGWCNDETQFFLVYEFMPNGSLDSHLFDKKSILTWDVRYRIIKGVASALLYLHEECEQCVVHRDIKPSNILLDLGFNAKLGDFGLARLMDHEQSHGSTYIAGTLGYLGPEYVMRGYLSKESDVYSFGMVALEIACGKKVGDKVDDSYFLEWVWGLHEKSELLSGVDQMLNNEFNAKEVECLMMVGLWCSLPRSLRPSIGQAIQVLKFEGALPDLPTMMPSYFSFGDGSDARSFSSTESNSSIDLIAVVPSHQDYDL
ncbi:hypothetical protein M8C21_029675, partial [Ambrosia artemisiifolia]